MQTETTAPLEPPASSAGDFRRAKYWTFTAGPGLFIRCLHLSFTDMSLLGLVSLPVLQQIASGVKPGETLADAFSDDEKREQLVGLARMYACRVAVAPRISAQPTDDPDVLYIGGDDPDLTDATLVRLMNDGAGRRLGVDLSGGLFRAYQRAAALADRSGSAPVRPAAEQPASPAGDAGPGPERAGDTPAEH